MSELSEKLGDSLRGYVRKRLIDPNGKVLYDSGENAVVYGGRNRLLRILGGNITGQILSNLKLSNGAVPQGGNHLNPSPALLTDTNLTGQTIVNNNLPVPTYSNLTATTPFVQYALVLSAANVNMIVNEMGLFFTDGSMFARHTFPTMDLRSTTGNSLEITWRIEI